jgi:hypothetical protein
MLIAESLRDAADVMDHGQADRLRARLRHGKAVQIFPGGRSGKPVLYQLK